MQAPTNRDEQIVAKLSELDPTTATEDDVAAKLAELAEDLKAAQEARDKRAARAKAKRPRVSACPAKDCYWELGHDDNMHGVYPRHPRPGARALARFQKRRANQ